MEAGALLVGEGDDGEVTLRHKPGIAQRRQHLDAGDDAERAVIAPARAHRVDMGAEDNGRPLLPALEDADDVADGVDLHLEAERRHLGDEPVAALPVLIAQGKAAATAFRRRTDGCQRHEP